MIRWAVLFAIPALALAAVPDCNLAPGWQQHGPSRSFDTDSLYEYMNGNSEGYFAYGFVGMKGVSCKKGEITILVDVSEMQDAESAYGIFSANRDASKPVEKLGMGSQIVPRKAIVAKDKYYLEIAVEPEGDHAAMLRELASALEKRVQGRTEPPEALGWFATENLLPGTPRLVPQSVLGIGLLKRGYVAQYQNKSKALVITEGTPESASAVMSKLRARFGETEKVQVGDDAFVANDKYLGRICITRKNRYIAGYAGVPDGQDAVGLTSQLIGRLP